MAAYVAGTRSNLSYTSVEALSLGACAYNKGQVSSQTPGWFLVVYFIVMARASLLVLLGESDTTNYPPVLPPAECIHGNSWFFLRKWRFYHSYEQAHQTLLTSDLSGNWKKCFQISVR